MNRKQVLELLIEIDERPEHNITADERQVLNQVKKLDLSFIKISELPASIGNLTNLQTLGLSYTKITELPDSIGNLTNLQSLDLSGTSLTELPDSIGNLTNLQNLDLGYTKTTELPAFIENLTNLQSLDLSRTSLTELPDSIGNLTNLQSLDLSRTSLTELPASIGNLTNLQSLDLSRTSLTELPASIGNLTNLQSLDLSRTSLTELPASIGNLTNLQIFDLGYTKITELPDSIGNLTNLQILNMSGTSLTELPDFIGKLINLREISLSYLSIHALPDFFGELKNLERVLLNNSKLDILPRTLIDTGLQFTDLPPRLIPSESFICIKDLQLTKQPIDMFLQNDRELIADWYRNHEAGNTIVINESKVVFLGDGDVGKTYSIKRLMRDGEKESEENADYYKTTMTHGIIIEEKEESLLDGTELLLRYWDFGGQTIMHSMHRCFLTDNTCYVIMISTRNDRDQMTQARYWLRNVQSFANQAPVILLVNQWGHLTESIDKKRLYEEYSILKDIIVLNIKESEPEEFNSKLHNTIINQIMQIDTFGEEWPIPWNNVRNEIVKTAREEKNYYISQDRFQEICTKNHLDGIQLQSGLLERFNWLGVCFSYHQEKMKDTYHILEDFKILNPEWLTNAIYLIIMNGAPHTIKGILTYGGVQAILKHPEDGESKDVEFMQGVTYSKEECEYVLEIMRKFGLSYKTEDGEFIPVLCKEERPDNLIPDGWNRNSPNEDHVRYILRYSYKPDTIIQRLMVNCKRNNIPIEIWSNGFRVAYPEFGLTMIVDAGQNEEDIILDVYSIRAANGDKHGTHLLMNLILTELNQINHDLNLIPTAQVELKGENYTDRITLNRLINRVKKGKRVIDGEEDEYEIKPILLGIYGTEVLKAMEIILENEKDQLSYSLLEQIASDYGRILLENPYTEKSISQNICIALQKIQANHNLWGRKEDDFNTALRDLIPDVYQKRDQTLVGTGRKRRAAGELDLELLTTQGVKLALVEALRLDSVAQDNLELHIDKALDDYNPNGLPYTYLVVYCEAGQLELFWENLTDFMKEYQFKAPISICNGSEFAESVINYQYTNVRHGSMNLKRNGTAFSFHVFMIDVRDRI